MTSRKTSGSRNATSFMRIPGKKPPRFSVAGGGVRDLLRSELFYAEVIGFRVVGRRTGMTFLSLGGQHHDLALYEAGPRARMPGAGNLGVVHLAFAMEDESALRRFYAFLKGKAEILRALDHSVARSFYVAAADVT